MVRKKEHMFEKTNLTPLGIDILLLLSRSPGKEYYVRELASELGASVSGCHTALGKLEEMNFVCSRTSGKNKYYATNEENPALHYFKIMMNIQELNELVTELKEHSTKIILFGSCSTGEDTNDSDIDLLVVAEDVNKAKKMIKAKSINGRVLRPVVVAPHKLLEMKETNRAFYDETNRGIALWRRKDE